jgi:hypothetical protein
LPKNLVQALVAQKTSVLNTQALTGEEHYDHCKALEQVVEQTQQLKNYSMVKVQSFAFRIVQKVKNGLLLFD